MDYGKLASELDKIGPELTPDERGMIREALEATREMPPAARQAAAAAAAKLAVSLGRRRAKARANKHSDQISRVLVGARVPRDRAQLYADAAQSAGVSLYRWVVSALDAALPEK